MAVKFQDYYKTLGVEKNASEEDLKRAFRKLARKYHPDVNKDPASKGKFEAVSEAYEVLKDPDKRRRYDELGANYRAGQDFSPPPGFGGRGGGAGGGGGAGQGFRFEGGFSDFFETVFGGARRGRGGGGMGGVRGGGMGGADLGDLLGGGMGGGRGPSIRPPDQTVDLTIGFDEAYHGSHRSLTLQSGDGSTQNVDVKIPAGVTDGSRLRLREQGLLLRLSIESHPIFKIEGRNVIVDIPLEPWEAALGTKKSIPTPTGEVTLTIPPGTNTTTRLRLKGLGLPPHGKATNPGDLYAQAQIIIPKPLSDAQRAAYESLRNAATS